MLEWGQISWKQMMLFDWLVLDISQVDMSADNHSLKGWKIMIPAAFCFSIVIKNALQHAQY